MDNNTFKNIMTKRMDSYIKEKPYLFSGKRSCSQEFYEYAFNFWVLDVLYDMIDLDDIKYHINDNSWDNAIDSYCINPDTGDIHLNQCKCLGEKTYLSPASMGKQNFERIHKLLINNQLQLINCPDPNEVQDAFNNSTCRVFYNIFAMNNRITKSMKEMIDSWNKRDTRLIVNYYSLDDIKRLFFEKNCSCQNEDKSFIIRLAENSPKEYTRYDGIPLDAGTNGETGILKMYNTFIGIYHLADLAIKAETDGYNLNKWNVRDSLGMKNNINREIYEELKDETKKYMFSSSHGGFTIVCDKTEVIENGIDEFGNEYCDMKVDNPYFTNGWQSTSTAKKAVVDKTAEIGDDSSRKFYSDVYGRIEIWSITRNDTKKDDVIRYFVRNRNLQRAIKVGDVDAMTPYTLELKQRLYEECGILLAIKITDSETYKDVYSNEIDALYAKALPYLKKACFSDTQIEKYKKSKDISPLTIDIRSLYLCTLAIVKGKDVSYKSCNDVFYRDCGENGEKREAVEEFLSSLETKTLATLCTFIRRIDASPFYSSDDINRTHTTEEIKYENSYIYKYFFFETLGLAILHYRNIKDMKIRNCPDSFNGLLERCSLNSFFDEAENISKFINMAKNACKLYGVAMQIQDTAVSSEKDAYALANAAVIQANGMISKGEATTGVQKYYKKKMDYNTYVASCISAGF